MSERTKVVAGNWKMNHGPEAVAGFVEGLELPAEGPRVMLFPPALSVAAMVARRPRGVEVGVQNIHWEPGGAFTGEVSAEMAREAGATLALIGHSERRHLFGETDEEVARKVEAAHRAGLTPLVCVGETLEQRRAGRVEEVILAQLDAALEVVDPDDPLIVAYEPVWAIGTGETATPDDAAAAHGALRARTRERGPVDPDRLAILYGGSVKPGNAAELMAAPDVDGVLVGGASLDPVSFAAIVRAGR